VKWKKKREYLS